MTVWVPAEEAVIKAFKSSKWLPVNYSDETPDQTYFFGITEQEPKHYEGGNTRVGKAILLVNSKPVWVDGGDGEWLVRKGVELNRTRRDVAHHIDEAGNAHRLNAGTILQMEVKNHGQRVYIKEAEPSTVAAMRLRNLFGLEDTPNCPVCGIPFNPVRRDQLTCGSWRCRHKARELADAMFRAVGTAKAAEEWVRSSRKVGNEGGDADAG